jgi:hypothetical protein
MARHRPFITEHFRECTLQAHLEKYWESDNPPDFNCISSFVSVFITKNRFSRWGKHFTRRPGASAETIQGWIIWLTELLRTHDNDLVMNCDETSWNLFPSNVLTRWETGAEDATTFIKGDEKDCMIVLATKR